MITFLIHLILSTQCDLIYIYIYWLHFSLLGAELSSGHALFSAETCSPLVPPMKQWIFQPKFDASGSHVAVGHKKASLCQMWFFIVFLLPSFREFVYLLPIIRLSYVPFFLYFFHSSIHFTPSVHYFNTCMTGLI